MVLATVARADSVVLDPDRDSMILGELPVGSNGGGQQICVGKNGGGDIRRGLLRFDLSAIPAGSSVTAVTLTLVQNNGATTPADFDLHRLEASWGEGASQPPAGECVGTSALLNDTTWLYRFYDPDDEPGSPAWSSLGGDFDGTASATSTLSGSGSHSWSSSGMVTDVQGWLDDPGSNHGWLVKRQSEAGSSNARRFGSRQNNSPSQRPTLSVTYTPASGTGACCLTGQVCQELAGGTCALLNGVFQGGGTDCDPNPCPADPTGACCFDDGTCSVETQTACMGLAGNYQGDGTDCAFLECPILLEPFVDALPIPPTAQPVTGTSGGAAHYEIAMREVTAQLHRDLPPTTVWAYGDGPSGAIYPGPTIETTSDVPISVDWINDLRDSSVIGDPKPLRTDHYLDVAGTEPPPACRIHGAQDLPKAVVHLHGAHVQAEFDGYPESTYLPGHSEIYTYANHQLPSTLWYHDHALGITRLNVYMGLAGAYIIRDAFEDGLGLPSGEYEVPLIIQDRSFHPDGRLKYPSEWVEHYFGEMVLVNGKVWPYLDVKRGKYRFRVLNGSGSRTYSLTLDRLDTPGPIDVSFYQIGTDGGLMPASLELGEITLGPAERADVVIDFEEMPAGTEVVMSSNAPAPYPAGASSVLDVMKFVVQDEIGDTAPLPSSLRPLEVLQETDAIRTRDFELDKEPDACGARWTINGLGWDDVVEHPQLGTTEIWRFINSRNIMHPMHMHLVMFQLLDRTPIDGGAPVSPEASEIGWKDTARADPGMITRVIARFEDYPGLFAYHCHILEHEDHEMMRQFLAVEAVRVDVDRTQISWSPRSGATGYDIVRGDLGQLRATGGNFAFASVTETCVDHDVTGASVPDTDTPPGGGGYWYLVRADDAGGQGTYDSGRASQVDYRDDEIDASGNDCP